MQRSRDLTRAVGRPSRRGRVDNQNQNARTIREHYRYNGPLEPEPSTRRLRGRNAVRRSWDGSGTTPAQQRELDDLRKFEAAQRCDERARAAGRPTMLPNLKSSMGGTSFIALRDAGKASAYRVARGAYDALQLDKRERAYLSWLLAAQLGFHADWLVARHVDMAELMDCCETYAARASRSLVARGLVERQPLYDVIRVAAVGGAHTYKRHVRQASAYRVPASALDRLGIGAGALAITLATRVMNEATAPRVPEQKYQASDIQPLGDVSGLPGDLSSRGTVSPHGGGDGLSSVPCERSVRPVFADSPTRTATLPAASPRSVGGEPDEESPLASVVRRAAMLPRTLAQHLDSCTQRAERKLEERLREVGAERATELEARGRELATYRRCSRELDEARAKYDRLVAARDADMAPFVVAEISAGVDENVDVKRKRLRVELVLARNASDWQKIESLLEQIHELDKAGAP